MEVRNNKALFGAISVFLLLALIWTYGPTIEDAQGKQLQEATPPSLQLPPVEPTLPPLEEAPLIEEKIRGAIENDQAAATGDPILDGILDVLKQRGSVLDGSLLDSPPVVAAPVNQAEQEAYCLAAEKLLETARILSQLPSDPSGQRQQLITQMRDQAARCMSDWNASRRSAAEGLNQPRPTDGVVPTTLQY